MRNSHLLSIAPTGTISLAFADNASNGIEPPFSWTYTRKKRMADGTFKEYAVEDYAWRLYKHLGGDVTSCREYFVTALEISAQAHKDMVAAVAPYVDTSISKTVNVPRTTPTPSSRISTSTAWKSGLKGLATYRPNSVLGSVLSVTAEAEKKQPQDVEIADANRACPSRACPHRCCPACAGPAARTCPTATRPGPTCSTRRRRVRPLRRPHRKQERPRKPSRSKCG
jgi:ribonucleoside-diphosphate reductase alpha chain